MPITKSAHKARRSASRKRVFNVARRDALKSALKDLRRTTDAKAARALLPSVYQTIDKAVKRGILKPNTAARKKAQAARFAKSLLVKK